MSKINAESIDLEMAWRMTRSLESLFPDDEPYTYESDYFRKVIDFDELAAIKPPKGYGIEVWRNITIRTTSFRGICPGAVHYYCTINFYGPSLMRGDCSVCGYLGGLKVGRIFGGHSIDVNRPVTEDDLADKRADWEGFHVGDYTHRWDSTKDAIECAKACVKLRFKNYGEITIDDVEG